MSGSGSQSFDAVFVGGGGPEVLAVVLARLRPAGAVVATFAYRLFAYWLQLPLGLLGLALQRAPAATARRESMDPG